MGRCITRGHGMTKLTDSQVKILKYLEKRKTPATSKQVHLQTGVNWSTTGYTLNSLSKRGYVKRQSKVINFVREIVYEFLTWQPAVKTIKNPVKFAKTRITIEPRFFNNPFNMGAS
jgi:predicted transcriptional regulator